MTTSTPGALTAAYQRRVEKAARVPYLSTAVAAMTPRVGGRVGDVVALVAAVARGGDDDHALLQGVLHRLVLARLGVRGVGVVAEGEVDDVGAVVGGPADAVGEGVAAGGAGLGAGGVAVLQDHPDGQDLRLGGDAQDAVGAAGSVAVPGDDAGHGGAVPAPGAVAGLGAEADHVLGGQDVAGEVRVVGLDAGVQDGDGDAAALRGLPGLVQVEGGQGPLLGADAVGVGGGGRQQGEGAGEQQAHRRSARCRSAGRRSAHCRSAQGRAAGAARRSRHEGCSVAVPTVVRRRRSMRSARPWASLPRPAWAGAVVAPERTASAAGWGVSTVRPSAQPETE